MQMYNESEPLLEKDPQGLPVRTRKKTHEDAAEPQLVPEPASGPVAPEPRKPGDTLTITDEDGQSWTFTLPDAEKYSRIMGKRYIRIGGAFVMEYSPRTEALMMECTSPKPNKKEFTQGYIDWLTQQFWTFLNAERFVCQSDLNEVLAERRLKPHKVVEFKSPHSGRKYGLFIPDANQFSSLIPRREELFDVESNSVIIETSIYDRVLEVYLDPRLTPEFMRKITPRELEYLETAAYLIFRVCK